MLHFEVVVTFCHYAIPSFRLIISKQFFLVHHTVIEVIISL